MKLKRLPKNRKPNRFLPFKIIFFFCLLLFFGQNPAAATPEESLQRISADPHYVNVADIPGVAVELRYSTTDNFSGGDIYGDFDRAFLHRLAAEKLKKAAAHLGQIKPGWKLLVLDALRPRSAQWILWNRVKGTKQQKYVLNPKKGSLHNYGFAVDLTLRDEKGKEVDMGTPYDNFTPLAEPRLDAKHLSEGKLTQDQAAHRELLRGVMEEAGFRRIATEWWHFDALPGSEVRKRYPIVE